jgi:hypothetical protein
MTTTEAPTSFIREYNYVRTLPSGKTTINRVKMAVQSDRRGRVPYVYSEELRASIKADKDSKMKVADLLLKHKISHKTMKKILG